MTDGSERRVPPLLLSVLLFGVALLSDPDASAAKPE